MTTDPDALTGISPAPPLRAVEDDGEWEEVIDPPEDGQEPIDESDTPDDDPDEDDG